MVIRLGDPRLFRWQCRERREVPKSMDFYGNKTVGGDAYMKPAVAQV